MNLLDRFRGRFSGFSQVDVDPHEWRLRSPSLSSSRDSSSDSSSHSSIGDNNNKNGSLIPDPAVFRNAVVPFGSGVPGAAPAVVDGRLTYPDVSHVAVHLALLECFEGLRSCCSGGSILGQPYPHVGNSDSDNDELSSNNDYHVIDEKPTSNIMVSPTQLLQSEKGKGGEGGGPDEGEGKGDDDDEAQERRRWDIFVHLAVTRFGAWWANIDKVLDHAIAYTPLSYHQRLTSRSPRGAASSTFSIGGAGDDSDVIAVVQLTPDYLPPLDVLLVWYAVMLSSPGATASNPLLSSSLYDEVCHHHPALQHVCFPWPAIRDVLDFSGPGPVEYRLPRAAANLFRTLTGQPADVFEQYHNSHKHLKRDEKDEEKSQQKAQGSAYVPHLDVDNTLGDSNGGGNSGEENGEEKRREDVGIGIGIDLFATVKAQEPFLAHVGDLDWLRGPALVGSLARAGEAYRDFMLRRGEQTAASQQEHENEDENEQSVGNPDNHDDDDDDGDGDQRNYGDGERQKLYLLPFGIDLVWRTHRLFPAQYRLFLHEGGGEVLAPGRHQGQEMCECWTCERIRDEAPGFAYDITKAQSKSLPPYDAGLLRALSTERLRSIQEDLGVCHATRETRRRRRQRQLRQRQEEGSSALSLPAATTTTTAMAHSPRRMSTAGRILSKGIKAVEERRRSWRLD